VISDLDIWRAANLICQAEGLAALDEVRQTISRLASYGDEEGVKVWLRIMAAIRELQAGMSGKPN
jgi:hypothetical protein